VGAALVAALAVLAGAVAAAGPGAPTVRAGEPVDTLPAGVSTAPVATPRVAWHGPREERVVALTFDDGWNPRTLRQVHNVLLRERVPATFFVTGIYVQRAPDLWRRIAASGFGLANHSYLHRDARDLTPRQVALDAIRTAEVVEAATDRPMLGAFRPPYGYRTPAIDAVIAAAGFPAIVMWDVTARDTVRGATVARVVRDASAGRPGSIVLLHAGPGVTARALPAIIARYRARGFRFVTLEELLDVRARRAPALEASGPGPGSRQLDRAERDRGLGGGAAIPAGPPPPDDEDAAPTGSAASTTASRGPAERPPAARAAAWARRDGTPETVALFTAALLGLLLVAAAAAGHGSPVAPRPDADAMPGAPRGEGDDVPA
jgi:peptidoglycan/xylan/chitin deacetylase (PgdA/CDA1 family)